MQKQGTTKKNDDNDVYCMKITCTDVFNSRS